MAGEWMISELADVCDRVSAGYVGPTSEYFCDSSVGVRLLRSQNVRPGRLNLEDVKYVERHFHAKNKKSQLRTGDILFVRVGQNRGDCCVVPDHIGELNCANIVFARPKKGLGAFLGFYFRSPLGQHELRSISTGSAQGVLNTRAIASLKVPVPSDDEAEAIASVLGALDDKIELNRRMNATLEAMARALFQSWFVDFDPVRAKLDGRKPVGLDDAAAALFSGAVQDSEVGHIPKGWTVEPVGEVVNCVGGGTPSTTEAKYWVGGTHHWTTPKDFSSLQAPVLLDTDRKLTDAGIAKISSGLLPAGTLLLSSRAPVGYLAIAAIPVAINQGFIALKCNERASNFFLLNWCQANIAEIEQRATGTTFAEISKQNFRPIRVVLPPKDLMAAFTAKVDPLYAQITANLKQSGPLLAARRPSTQAAER